MAILTIPTSATLDLVAALELSEAIASTEECEELIFDFKKSRTIEPFAMLLISSEITRYKYRCKNTTTSCSNFRHMTYAGHMGFFKSFGLDFGNAPGEARGSSRYVPLTIYSCEEIRKSAAIKGTAVGDEVESISKKLTSLLCNGDNGPLFDTLSYSIRELMRNVVEHSNAIDPAINC